MISRDHKMGLKAKPLFGTATVATDTGLIKVRAYIYIFLLLILILLLKQVIKSLIRVLTLVNLLVFISP